MAIFLLDFKKGDLIDFEIEQTNFLCAAGDSVAVLMAKKNWQQFPVPTFESTCVKCKGFVQVLFPILSYFGRVVLEFLFRLTVPIFTLSKHLVPFLMSSDRPNYLASWTGKKITMRRLLGPFIVEI